MSFAPEQDEVHGFLAEVVELVEVTLDDVPQLLQVADLDVVLVGRLGVVEVAVDQAADVVLCDLAVVVRVEVDEELVEVLPQLLLDHVAGAGVQPGMVLLIYQAVVVHSEHLANRIVKLVSVSTCGTPGVIN